MRYETEDYNEMVNRQRKYYNSGATKDVRFRITQLKLLKDSILRRKNEIVEAIERDFGVCGEYEAYGRIMFILDEI